MEAHQAHRIRWAFNFEQWRPTLAEWQKALTYLQAEEVDRIGSYLLHSLCATFSFCSMGRRVLYVACTGSDILRFKRPIGGGVYLTGHENPDAKSSLIGRLMIRKLLHTTHNIPYSEIKLLRTKKGKPYQANEINKFPNFNFNVSHAGDYVVCGAEDTFLVGVDVMKIEVRGRSKHTEEDLRIEEFFNDMLTCFTAKEWRKIRSHGTSRERLEQFYLHWILKEAYIKAIGIGLGFELQRAEYTLDEEDENATISVDNKNHDGWHFEIHKLDEEHVASVAYGPPEEADESCAYINRNVKATAPHQLVRIGFTILTWEILLEGMEALR